jgi:hypothetical protein
MGMPYNASVMSEADLIAELYHRCKVSGITARLEVFVPSTIHRSKRMRVDVAIFRGNEIVACVEGKTPGGKIGGNTRQRNAYEALRHRYNIEVHWINSFGQIDALVRKLGELVVRT